MAYCVLIGVFIFYLSLRVWVSNAKSEPVHSDPPLGTESQGSWIHEAGTQRLIDEMLASPYHGV